MTDQTAIDWPTCSEDGCIGIPLARTPKCLAHASDEERNAALEQFSETGEIDARGVPVTAALFEQILAAAPHDEHHRATLQAIQFDSATFQGDVMFDEAAFQGRAWFGGATFHGRAGFDGATFEGDAGFGGATFEDHAGFDGATFEGDAWFGETAFQGRAWFSRATFHGRAQFSRATFQGDAWFEGATFKGGAGFGEATFQGDAWFHDVAFHGAGFSSATFHGRAGFDEATFQGDASFYDVAFEGEAGFDDVAFHGSARFARATFQGDAGFDEATFQDDAWFGETAFQGRARFSRATFQGGAWFARATFQGDAGFDWATFQRDAWFDEATFRRHAGFGGATFEQARQFGPCLAYRGLWLDDVQFAQPVQIEASTIGVCCRQARFAGGVQFRLRWARVVLDDSDLAAPSILAGIPRLTSDVLARREQRIARAWRRLLTKEISERPRLLSLQRADVAGLGLSSVELADCRFAGAHNLDRLRLEADVSFAAAPVWLRWDWRQVIAEERAWRAQRSGRWPAPRWPVWPGAEPLVLEAGQIAGLYRALRKGREDAKDEPGAADFYYGEMEMRRRARRGGEASRGRVERAILTAYWLVSGYGLRAWRALAWLAALIAAFALAFHLIGFVRPPQPDSYWTSLLYAFRSTLSLADDEVKLTAWGKLLQALLRITGPLLLGLALLAVRSRVKR